MGGVHRAERRERGGVCVCFEGLGAPVVCRRACECIEGTS